MWDTLSLWTYHFREAYPSVHPQLAMILVYLVFTWIYFRRERSSLAILPFLGGLLFLAPALIT